MKCEYCGASELIHDVRDVEYTSQGHSMILPRVEGDFCGVCGEAILGADESRRTMRLMLEFNRALKIRSDGTT